MIPIRNIAIIAHVDHGKTTLVDALLKQSQTKMAKGTADSLIMDSEDLEKERGITIFSKNASVIYKGIKINIIDTPGHADFGGEVERVLKMADGCLLLIDAAEGPMPQTRFVLKKALEMKHKIIVVVNKIDKKDSRPDYVLGKTLDLFFELGADDKTADFPIIYASGKEGKAGLDNNLVSMTNIDPLFAMILDQVPVPTGDPAKPLQLLITSLSADPHLGKIAIGRIYNGKISQNGLVSQITRENKINIFKVTSLMTYKGLERVETPSAQVGDIVALTGIPEPKIGETVSDAQNPQALPLIDVEEPTISITLGVNTSPFAGREGEFKSSRQIRERLYKELETDMALRVSDNPDGTWTVAGRGELHLAILIERMRREGYEFQAARPQVIDKIIDGQQMTPHERVFMEVPQESNGIVMQRMGERHGQIQDMKTVNGISYLEFIVSTKGLFGYRSKFITDTRGLGIINTSFSHYAIGDGFSAKRSTGSMVVHESGLTNLYGMTHVQDQGQLFVGPAVPVYKGQVVGENSRGNNLYVNVCKSKPLSNMRSKGEGVMAHFDKPKEMNLEAALEFIADDELVEITPKNIRIRKINLSINH